MGAQACPEPQFPCVDDGTLPRGCWGSKRGAGGGGTSSGTEQARYRSGPNCCPLTSDLCRTDSTFIPTPHPSSSGRGVRGPGAQVTCVWMTPNSRPRSRILPLGPRPLLGPLKAQRTAQTRGGQAPPSAGSPGRPKLRRRRPRVWVSPRRGASPHAVHSPACASSLRTEGVSPPLRLPAHHLRSPGARRPHCRQAPLPSPRQPTGSYEHRDRACLLPAPAPAPAPARGVSPASSGMCPRPPQPGPGQEGLPPRGGPPICPRHLRAFAPAASPGRRLPGPARQSHLLVFTPDSVSAAQVSGPPPTPR